MDIERARSLGLNLEGEVRIGGAGAGTLRGSNVRDASLTVVGLEGNVQPVVLAIPLDGLEPRFGHDIDGIIGGDFIKQFVLEVDYPLAFCGYMTKTGSPIRDRAKSFPLV